MDLGFLDLFLSVMVRAETIVHFYRKTVFWASFDTDIVLEDFGIYWDNTIVVFIVVWEWEIVP